MTTPSFRNCHAVDDLALPAERDQPQDRRKRTRYRKIGAEVDADQYCRLSRDGDVGAWLTVAAISPAGRLFIRFDANATTTPAPKAVGAARLPRRHEAARVERSAARRFARRAATSTNNPATSGSTPHDISRSTGSGDCRLMTSTTTVTAVPAMNVGRPSCSRAPRRRAARRLSAQMPAATHPAAERQRTAAKSLKSPDPARCAG